MKVPFVCKIFKLLCRPSPSCVFLGCKIGRRPTSKCFDCPYYSPFMREFERLQQSFWIKERKSAYMPKQLLTEKEIKSAEEVLSKGDRVELIPVKDGIKVMRVRREEVKNA